MYDTDIKIVEEELLRANRERFLFPEFEFAIKDDKLICLGSGGSSYVYIMTSSKRPDSYYALKVTGFNSNSGSSEDFWNSARIQRLLCEENNFVVRTLGAVELVIDFDNDKKITVYNDSCSEKWDEEGNRLHLRCLLMEKLEPVIKKDRFGKAFIPENLLINETEIIIMSAEIGLALMDAHHSGVLHRDIKLENILYDNISRTYKLGDFSMAKYTGGNDAETVVYTDGYGAPEIERHFYDSYNVTADIYSFGITLYLLFNDLKFPGSDGYYPRSELQYSPEFVFPAPAHAPEELTRIIRKMCSFKPEDRYQFLGDALTEVIAYAKRTGAVETEKHCEAVEMETETFHEESDESDVKSEKKQKGLTRSGVKHLLEMNSTVDVYFSRFFMVILMLLLIPFFGMHGEAVFVAKMPLFWLLPAGLLIEALFQRIREFHIMFAFVFEAFILLYAIGNMPAVPVMISALAIIFGAWELSFAAGFSLFVWMLLSASGKEILPGIMSFGITRIILMVLILCSLAKFLDIRLRSLRVKKALTGRR